MKTPNGSFLFGRVVIAKAQQSSSPMPGAHLIYIYDERSLIFRPQTPLLPGRLLLPPVWTNDLGWKEGYFQTIQNEEIGEFDLLKQHCFRVAPLGPNLPVRYVDELGNPLMNSSEPCGTWGLVSYKWIDDHISDAIGIPRSVG